PPPAVVRAPPVRPHCCPAAPAAAGQARQPPPRMIAERSHPRLTPVGGAATPSTQASVAMSRPLFRFFVRPRGLWSFCRSPPVITIFGDADITIFDVRQHRAADHRAAP